MLSTSTQILRLSQGHLNLLERCPRQFQHIYLEQLHSPLNPEHEERQSLGSRFHLLMQQRELGLPIDTLLAQDSQLQRWMIAFANAAPEIITPVTDDQVFRESEHYRTLQFQDYLLTVVYDLLIADSQQAQIFDWKTYPKLPAKRNLEQNWQTRLYLYVLAETSNYPPENISMSYWFVQTEGKPQSIKFIYNTLQHQQTAKKLSKLLTKLNHWLNLYQQGQPFPQVAEGNKACDYCQYATRCNRTTTTSEPTTFTNSPGLGVDNSLLNLASIEEVSL